MKLNDQMLFVLIDVNNIYLRCQPCSLFIFYIKI